MPSSPFDFCWVWRCSLMWWLMGGTCWAAGSRGAAGAFQAPVLPPLLWLEPCACLPVSCLWPTGKHCKHHASLPFHRTHCLTQLEGLVDQASTTHSVLWGLVFWQCLSRRISRCIVRLCDCVPCGCVSRPVVCVFMCVCVYVSLMTSVNIP